MIPENREKVEREDIIQALQSYLRQEASYEAMQHGNVAEGMEKRLAIKARDYAIYHGDKGISDDECTALAHEAVSRYMGNWQGKKQGEDDRGHRLGKSSLAPF